MYFSNMLEENGVKTYERCKKVNTVPFVCECNPEERVSNAHVALRDNFLVVSGDSNEEDVFSKGLQGEGIIHQKYNKKSSLTYAEIQETNENPLITVLAKGINFYEGVKTYIKFINISDEAVLACLVYGACEFEFSDGSFIPMQRCNAQDVDTKKKRYYTGSDMRGMSVLRDKESDYDMTYDIVNAVIVDIKNEGSVSYRTVHSDILILSDKNLLQARKRVAERKQREEERKAKEAESRKQAAIAAKAKAEQEKKSVAEEQYRNPSKGAAAFLAAVAQLKSEN